MVWKASATRQVRDLVTVCKKCNTRTSVDHLKEKDGSHADEHTEHVNIETEQDKTFNLSKKVCPSCGTVGQFGNRWPLS
jgi:glycyl-tRNA synthetase (class II)